jgi:hypothetical protein
MEFRPMAAQSTALPARSPSIGQTAHTPERWLARHNISQTSTYLAASGGGDAEAMAAFDWAMGRLAVIAEQPVAPIGDRDCSKVETPESPTVH